MSNQTLQKLNRQQINVALWDDCVATSNFPLHYGLSWYLDIVSSNWEGLILQENGKYLAVMPLPIRKKFGLKYIHQPLFCQLAGVWTQDENLVPIFLETLPTHFSYIATFHIFNHFPWRVSSLAKEENNPHHESQSTNQATKSRYLAARQSPFEGGRGMNTHTIDLSPAYQTLNQNYTPDRQLNLKRAKKANWQIQESTDITPMIQLFKENTEHKIKGGVGDWAYIMLENLYKALNERGLATLWYAEKEGVIEAGALFTIYQNRIIYLFNTASPIGRKGNARTLMIDKMIEQYATQSFVFDFESPDNELITDFYKSFGAKEETFWQVSYNRSWWVKCWKQVRNLYYKIL
jgi:hypothetical protein